MENPIEPIEIHEDPVKSESEKLDNWFEKKRNYSIVSILIILIGLIICFTWQFPKFNSQWPISAERWGQFGDFFGGVIGTFITYLSIVFLYKAFKEQRLGNVESHETNLKVLQQNNVLTQIEDKHLYNELVQQYENKFNRLLHLYQETISYYNDSQNLKNDKICFADKIASHLSTFSFPIDKPYHNRITEASKTFEIFIHVYRQQVSNHMRLLFQILCLLDSEEIMEEDRVSYAKVFRSQLTDKELILIRYNCLNKRGEKMRFPVFHFNILKFLPLIDLFEFSEYRKYLNAQQINILNDELINIRKRIHELFNNVCYGEKKRSKWKYPSNYELSISVNKNNQLYSFILSKTSDNTSNINESIAECLNCFPENLLLPFIIDFNKEIFKYSTFRIYNRNCKFSYRKFTNKNKSVYSVAIKDNQPIIVSYLQVKKPTSFS